MTNQRCGWCGVDPLYVAYHDEEWGVPSRDERALFELLILEGMQAGLSWLTILRKRAQFRRAFKSFAPEVIARFGRSDEERLLADAGIVRNRAKIAAAIGNARALLALHDRGESLSTWLWEGADRPAQNRFRTLAEVPAQTPASKDLSRRLHAAGFRFVGPTICYAWMQASGRVNDHLLSCPRHDACSQLGTI
ncbi:MAG: DNA-3-methyladenine glycosylase I [Gammaproteobacteria bacterium]|nr:MAG: DNA-3-methyladenine glycosylase I [Gammaproteobacteria bacterium]